MPIPTNIAINSNGGIFVQPSNCGTEPYSLDCSMLDSVEIQLIGDTESRFCIDKGRYKRVATIVGPPDDGELEIITYMANEQNWLDNQYQKGSCAFPIYVYWDCPFKDNPNKFRQALKIENARITAHAIGSAIDRMGNDSSTHVERTYTISYSPTDATLLWYPSPILTPVTPTIATDLADVAYIFDDTNCVGDCADERLACSTGYTAGNGDGATNGSPLVGVNEDCQVWSQIGSWYIGAATDDIISMIASDYGTQPRIVMVDSVAPSTIHYADGYTPTASTNIAIVDSVTAVPLTGAATGPNSLYQRGDGSIWLVTDTGDIAYSEDNAITWRVITGAGNDLNAIHFIDDLNGVATGDDGELLFSNNGGLSWTATTLTGFGADDDIISVKASGNRWYVLILDATGPTNSIYSKTIGSNLDEPWTVQPNPITTGATAKDMDVKGCNIVVIWENGGGTNIGRVSFSINGGYNWSNPDETGQVVANTGFNAVYLRKDLEATIVGNAGVVVQLTGLTQA